MMRKLVSGSSYASTKGQDVFRGGLAVGEAVQWERRQVRFLENFVSSYLQDSILTGIWSLTKNVGNNNERPLAEAKCAKI